MNVIASHRNRPCRGETRSGDIAIVRAEESCCLLAIIDALGHGPQAADVAEMARTFLDFVPLDQGVAEVMKGLHAALRSSRGAAGTVCLVSGEHVEASGVGNVSLRAYGSPLSVMLTPGILGSRMRTLRVFRAEVCRGTRLILHSDGIRARFGKEDVERGTPEQACAAIMQGYARLEDDATVLIADVS